MKLQNQYVNHMRDPSKRVIREGNEIEHTLHGKFLSSVPMSLHSKYYIVSLKSCFDNIIASVKRYREICRPFEIQFNNFSNELTTLNVSDLNASDGFVSSIATNNFKPVIRNMDIWRQTRIATQNVQSLGCYPSPPQKLCKDHLPNLVSFRISERSIWEDLQDIPVSSVLVPIDLELPGNKMKPWRNEIVDQEKWAGWDKEDAKRQIWTNRRRNALDKATGMLRAKNIPELRRMVSSLRSRSECILIVST